MSSKRIGVQTLIEVGTNKDPGVGTCAQTQARAEDARSRTATHASAHGSVGVIEALAQSVTGYISVSEGPAKQLSVMPSVVRLTDTFAGTAETVQRVHTFRDVIAGLPDVCMPTPLIWFIPYVIVKAFTLIRSTLSDVGTLIHAISEGCTSRSVVWP